MLLSCYCVDYPACIIPVFFAPCFLFTVLPRKALLRHTEQNILVVLLMDVVHVHP